MDTTTAANLTTWVNAIALNIDAAAIIIGACILVGAWMIARALGNQWGVHHNFNHPND